MRNGKIVAVAFGVCLGGASTLSGAVMQDEGLCVWNLSTSRPCEEYDLVEECDAQVLSECHSPNWHVSQASCTTGQQIISCKAAWQNP